MSCWDLLPPLPDPVKTMAFTSQTCTNQEEPSTWFDSLFWWNRKQQERWVKSKDLGVGAFGHVWLESCSSSDSEPPKLRAVKRVQKVIMFHHNMDYTREIQAMVRFSQPKYASFFVKSLGWFEDPDSVYITMEYFELGDLSKYLSSQPLQEAEAREIIFQLLSGLELLHDNGFVHRDLKPANIFVVQGAPNWHVKIGDFGISKRVKDGTRLRTVIGTPQYLAPEVRDAYTNSVDMWSVGVISFYILTGSLPFKNSSHVRAFVRGVESSLTSQKFIEALIVVEPARRLSAARALQHAWFETLKQVKSASTDGDESDILPGRFSTK
ncbi:kinase-like protein [Aspergillus violaceofuscus CBS 115571]|uniref:Serine/threonine-protein kinase ATG1 n=1 Tax=Aspergillus violaceofuscus (strain CBS 115571) TaxID=1450538 RepID=A0A2V5HNM9_ASPV1|nr:kinase-like protein [Aspergillus violaceofuscus CBS 115571]